jgi:hypothetical protein
MAHNLAPIVVAIPTPLQQFSAEMLEHVDWIMTPLTQPMHHAGQDIRGYVVPLHDLSRRGDPGGLPNVPNLAGIWNVQVHATSEF